MTKEQLISSTHRVKQFIGGQVDALEEKHQTLAKDLPAKHAAYFEKPWRNYIQPERQKQNALSSTAKAPTAGEGSSRETPKPVSDMAEALGFPNGTWLANPAGEAVQMTDELREAIKSHLGQ
jgi:hypothetical protein